MNASYRIVHFMPNPLTGARLPVAALLSVDGVVSVIRAAKVPGLACLGRPETSEAMEVMIESLREADTLDRMPAAVGPQALLDAPRGLPRDVEDPATWIRDWVLPHDGATPRRRAPEKFRRATFGKQFFKQFGVHKMVNALFRPSPRWGDSSTLRPISQWTGEEDLGLLLLEPLVPTRNDLDVQLRDVGTRFSAYRWHMDHVLAADQRPNADLVAYVLPGGLRQDRLRAIGALEHAQAAHRIVDTTSEPERTKFIGEIRDLGSRALRQASLA